MFFQRRAPCADSIEDQTLAIILRIDNIDQLPDGGPIEFSAGNRGFQIGRHQHCDWCLPDPARTISGVHCRVHYENGAYWLTDESRNGTFLGNAPGRISSPYQLRNDDRLRIGDYIINVSINSAADVAGMDAPVSQMASFEPPSIEDMWSVSGPTPSPVPPRSFIAAQSRQRMPDVLDDFIDLPSSTGRSPFDQGGAQPMPAQRYSAAAPGPGYSAPGPGYAAPGAAGYPGAGTPPAMGQSADITQFLIRLASNAGVSPQAFANRSPDEIADELGIILRMVTEQLIALLRARADVKLMTKSARTTISARDNNPLKFLSDPSEALHVMVARDRPGFMGAASSLQDGFADIKKHEFATYAAMQSALARVMDDLSPDRIEEKVGSPTFGSKKSKAWDLYVERWEAKTERSENGALDLFLKYFAEAYDASSK